jgi:ABC-type thiamine transport system ATPase subunit
MRSNVLGDIRAENDLQMLDMAFYETPDYKALLTSSDRCVVVGRRGTGKSALVHQLHKYWHSQRGIFVISLAPQEDQIIGIRGISKVFGENFIHIKAGVKIAWKYALYMEIAQRLNSHYKIQKAIANTDLPQKLKVWGGPSIDISTKVRQALKKSVSENVAPEDNIAEIASNLEIDVVESALKQVFKETNINVIFLVDRLDEGYTPDTLGVAIVDGFVQSVIDLNAKFNGKVRGVAFLRDNMYRSIAINDPDFTRNIEGQVLRLHWDEYALFNMVCNRLRVAFNAEKENSTKIWNSYSARELSGREGFKYALRLTLYRPRDILVLLNNAFLNAVSQNRTQIVMEDINRSAKSISDNRLSDLEKEYESIFPALKLFTSSFSSGSADLSLLEAREKISVMLAKDDHEIKIQRDISIFENPNQVLQRLYGIGFIGIYDRDSSSFIFSHDGRDPVKEVRNDARILIHPCYWLALNVHENSLEKNQAEEIYDEYDIEVSSITDEQRQARIGKIIEEIKSIEPGHKDCHEFEEWCLHSIKLIFAGSLSNIELHPNKNGRQQRDILATNMATTPVWSRILSDYGARQIIFEIKNYDDLSEDEYRQMNTYMANEHGRLAFIINRSPDNNLKKGKELDWAQELYFNHNKKIVIKLSEKYLTKHLSKLRSPQKHDAANIELNKLIDTYIRQYLILKAK